MGATDTRQGFDGYGNKNDDWAKGNNIQVFSQILPAVVRKAEFDSQHEKIGCRLTPSNKAG